MISSADITKSTNDSNKIQQAYDNAEDYFKDIYPNLKYKEFSVFSTNALPIIVDVGCICNSEVSGFKFDVERYWDKDSIEMSIQNSNKMSNDLEWENKSNLHNTNGTIQSSPGMVTLFKDASNYIKDDVNYFDDVTNQATPIPEFNKYNTSVGGNGTAVDIFGYFNPDTTGNWKFSIPTSNKDAEIYTYLWMGNSALYEYTAANANINSDTPAEVNETVSATFKLAKNDYIPFRIQIISKNVKFGSQQKIPMFIVTPPSDSPATGVITKNTQTWNYFVTFTKDGAIYYKNLLYFGLVKSPNDTDKYNCFLISTTPTNANYIRNYKQNPKLQYIKTEIPNPIMTGRGAPFSVLEGDELDLSFCSGINIRITKAIFGMPEANYNYITYSTKNVAKEKTIPRTTKTNILPYNDKFLNFKSFTTTAQSYKAMVNTPTQVANPAIPINQQIDVTEKLNSLIQSGGTRLKINSGSQNFTNIFGQSIADPINDPNGSPKVRKTLFIEYMYTVNESAITDKYLGLDPQTGAVTITAVYNGDNKITAPLPMDKVPACSGDNCGSYSMKLTNNCRLSVMNANNTEVGYLDLKRFISTNNPTFKIEDCQINNMWLKDASITNFIPAGSNTSTVTGKKIKSLNGRFKLGYENRKLTLTHCIIPYTKHPNGTCYTTNLNVQNNSQIYYLYRINSIGVFGRKFLEETSTTTGKTIMHYLPNTHSSILKPQDAANFFKPANAPAYPLFKDGSLSFSSKYKSDTTSATTSEACANQCIGDTNCEHFFFLKNNNGNTSCYTDIVSDANPAFTTNNSNPDITSSDLYKKQYNIETTCDYNNVYGIGNISNKQPLQSIGYTRNPFEIDYRNPDPHVNNTYFCSLDVYTKANTTVSTTYNTLSPTVSTTYNKQGKQAMENMTGSRWGSDASNLRPLGRVIEGYTTDTSYNQYAPDIKTNILNRIPILQSLADNYSKTQDTINDNYNQTINKLRAYEAVKQTMSSDYNTNSSDSLIPEKFINNNSTVPNITYSDGAKKDVGIMLMYQNTMYTLASITAATCLILGTVFTGGSD